MKNDIKIKKERKKDIVENERCKLENLNHEK